MVNQEYQTLYEVAKALQSSQDLQGMLNRVLKILTRFEELKVENKAGIFLLDEQQKVLRLYTTIGIFSQEFLEKEQEVPFGNCLCGRVAISGQLLTSDSCFTDVCHERSFTDMTEHGHYIIPLKNREDMVGVMFLYTRTNPTWYQHSHQVLLSIGGLIGSAIVHIRNEKKLRQSRDTLSQEVAERKKIETELLRYRDHLEDQVKVRTEQLRNLSNQLQSAREEEKTRIARTVHDELGQTLTALKLDLSWVERRLTDPSKAIQEKIHALYDLIESTIQRAQEISSELRPRVLDLMGLGEALRWQTRKFMDRAGIECKLVIRPGTLKLDTDRSTTLFRIYQELLTNIARHAKATKVKVICRQTPAQVELEVIDNGCGILPGKMDDIQSLGLAGIRERILIWQGEVVISGKAGVGTRVWVRLPMQGAL